MIVHFIYTLPAAEEDLEVEVQPMPERPRAMAKDRLRKSEQSLVQYNVIS